MTNSSRTSAPSPNRGHAELLEQIRQEGKSAELVGALIGRFGVGFYSAFMAADKVTLVTRRAGEETATQWESTGDGHYTLTPASKSQRGTSITLFLKPVDADSGIEDYTQSWVLSRIVKRYSDFVAYPIQLKEERDEVERDEQGLPKKDGKTTHVVEDKTLNSMKPIWTRSQSEVTEEEYTDFYKHIAHDWEAPLKTMTYKAEGRFEFQCLIFMPARAPFDLYYHTAEYGLQLYAQRVMIMEQCADLIPRYLRFLKGVVDSADLPLNISRQRLQQDRHITQIRSWLVRRVLDTLATMQKDDNETYLKFWAAFGRVLKEGIGVDYDNKDALVSLLLFPSSYDPERLTTLKAYVERMPAEQTEIFYLTGESRRVVENSPHLETFKAKGYEVLYLVDPVDELVVQSCTEFEGKKLQSVGKGAVQLGSIAARRGRLGMRWPIQRWSGSKMTISTQARNNGTKNCAITLEKDGPNQQHDRQKDNKRDNARHLKLHRKNVAMGPSHSNKVGSPAHRQSCRLWMISATMGGQLSGSARVGGLSSRRRSVKCLRCHLTFKNL